jgi:hypothetical protein
MKDHNFPKRRRLHKAMISPSRGVSVLNTMDVTTQEKVKAYGVFKSKENREIFLSAWSEDQEASLMWLRSEMT